MVIYDVASAEVRRIIVAEEDRHYDAHHLPTVGDGEAHTFIEFIMDDGPDYRSSLAKAQEAVARATGRFPPES
jgi:hypothetical protein